MKRELYLSHLNELLDDKKIILVSGARQVGKTTICQQLSEDYSNNIYFNYDSDRIKIINEPNFYEKVNRKNNTPMLVVFDELHKYRNWKSYIKGQYDKDRDNFRYIVTGSGDLSLSYKSKESLAGRFFLLHVFPLTINEFFSRNNLSEFMENPFEKINNGKNKEKQNLLEELLNISPFPEPFFKSKKSFYKRWIKSYFPQILNIDLQYTKTIHNLDKLTLLFELLNYKIGSPLSITGISNDLQISYPTVVEWLNLLKLHFIIFELKSYNKFSRAIRKQKKIYFYDYGKIEDEGIKFENLVALEFYRFVNNANDMGENLQLYYLKDKEQREVDFLITKNNKPFLLIEAKINSEDIKNISYFQNKLNIPAILLLKKKGIYKILNNNKNKIIISTASKFLSQLP